MPEEPISLVPDYLHAEAFVAQTNSNRIVADPTVSLQDEAPELFWADPKKIQSSLNELKKIGFEISSVTRFGFHFSGKTELFAKSFTINNQLNLIIKDKKVVSQDNSSSLIKVSKDLFGGRISAFWIETIVEETFLGNAASGEILYSDSRLWSDIDSYAKSQGQTQLWQLARLLGAKAKETGHNKHYDHLNQKRYQYSGKGVHVHVLDSGFDESHPYFANLITKVNTPKLDANDVQYDYQEQAAILEYARIEMERENERLTLFRSKDAQSFSSIEEVDQFASRVGFLGPTIQGNLDEMLKLAKQGLRNEMPWSAVNVLYNNYKDTVIPTLEAYFNPLDKKYQALLQIFDKENYSHASGVVANLLAIAPSVNLHGKKMFLNMKKEDLQSTYFDHYFSRTKTIEDQLLKISKYPKGVRHVINVSAGIDFRHNFFETLDNSNSTIMVTASGNYGSSTTISDLPVANCLETVDFLITVGGAFIEATDQIELNTLSGKDSKSNDDLKLEKLKSTNLNYSSTACGYEKNVKEFADGMDFRMLQFSPPLICGLNGGPQNGMSKSAYPDQKLDGKKYLAGHARLWTPKVQVKYYDSPTGTIKETDGPSMISSWGTSYSAPQVAGVCALILQVWSGATPAHIKFILKESSTAINKGVSANGVPATKLNTGLVHIARAIRLTQELRNFIKVNKEYRRDVSQLKVEWFDISGRPGEFDINIVQKDS